MRVPEPGASPVLHMTRQRGPTLWLCPERGGWREAATWVCGSTFPSTPPEVCRVCPAPHPPSAAGWVGVRLPLPAGPAAPYCGFTAGLASKLSSVTSARQLPLSADLLQVWVRGKGLFTGSLKCLHGKNRNPTCRQPASELLRGPGDGGAGAGEVEVVQRAASLV